MSNGTGTLFIVATPIGNLQDLSPRARDVLAAVDLILVEDTRHSRRLLQEYSINVPLKSCHEHNEENMLQQVLPTLQNGSDIALISDAGTPLISDPGYRLVTAAHEHDIPVVPVPGPSACISALSASGLPSDHFQFHGYLPARQAARKKVLESLAGETATLILYEAPHRILETLQDAAGIFGADRPATLARELTKLHEEIHRSDLAGCIDWLETQPERIRGEFVFLIGGCSDTGTGEAEAIRVLKILLDELPKSRAAELAARITGLKKNDLYKLALKLDESSPEYKG